MIFSDKGRILNDIRKHYGENPAESFTVQRCRDRLAQIRILYDTFHSEDRAGSSGIDDVTWSDLEMDEVFLRVNQCQSYIGEQVLYQTLHSGDDAFFRDNRELMDMLSGDEKRRLDLSFRLRSIGKKKESYFLPEFFTYAGNLRPGHNWVLRVLQVNLAAAVLLAVIFRSMPFYIFLAAGAIVNFVVYCSMKMKYDVLLSSLSGIGMVLNLYEWCIRQKEIPLPDDGRMKDNWSVLRKIQKKIGFLVYTKQAGTSGDIAGILFDYLLGVTLIDVSRVDGILRLIDENMDTVLDAFTYVGRLDALISILSFRESLPSWSEPVFSGREGLNARGLYHPLIKDAVSNDFSLPARAILTGANASGKSTFMKALAINVLLAQTVNTCCCESFSLPVLKVMTSMAIRDDVVTGESYYVREVRYLKRMLDELASGVTTFCVIDEILKGTNQKERLAASQSVLKYLADYPGYCIIATHDMELVDKLKHLYEPYYFESNIEDNNVTFDYHIHKGLGGESNALALLKAFDFPDKVVQDAYRLSEESPA